MDSINALFSWVHFGHPELLWFLLGVPLVTLTSLWVAIRRARAMSNAYGDEALVGRFIERVSVKRLVAKSLALTVSLALLALALARPVQDSGKIEFPVGSVNDKIKRGVQMMTITPEFGPAPYMPLAPFTQEPLGNQWQINANMMQRLRSKLAT